MYCFYAAPRGEEPNGSNASNNWFQKINLAEDLLNFKRQKTQLKVSVMTLKKISSATEKQTKCSILGCKSPIWKINK
jgi:hypothetical protein